MIKLRLPNIWQKKPQNKRKKFLFFTVIAIFFLSGVGYIGAKNGWFGGGASIPEDTFSRGLVGYWSFEEGSGATVYDASGNGNNGTLTGGPKWATGKNGGALQFDGKDDWVNVGTGSSLNITNAITIEGWIKLANGVRSTIVGKGTGSIGIRTYLFSKEANNYLSFLWTDDNLLPASGVTSSIPLDNSWHYVAVTFNVGMTNLYIDGKNVGSGSGDTSIQSCAQTFLGSSSWGGGNPTGILDDIRIYNRALTAAEVKYHYNHGGPVAYWAFDEGSGTTAKDSSGNNNDGTLTNFSSTDTGTAEAGDSLTLTDVNKAWVVNKWFNGKISITGGTGSGQARTIVSNTANTITVSSAWATNPDATSVYSLVQALAWTDGKYGSAIQFDGENDYAVTPGLSSTNFLKTDAFTIEAWVYNSKMPNDWQSNSIVSNTDINDQYKGWGLNFSQTGKFNGSVAYFPGSWRALSVSSAKSYDINTWYHVVYVNTGVVGEQKIYVNGVNDTGVLTNNSESFSYNSSKQIYIGKRGTCPDSYYQGAIDDVKVYNYARTADEIRLDYQAGMATYFGSSGKACSEDPASCMDKGLVGYWDMDEGGGTVLRDKSGNGNNGIFTSSPKWMAGKIGGALSFDGKDDYITAPNNQSFNEVTVIEWVKFRDTKERVAFCKGRYAEDVYNASRQAFGIKSYNNHVCVGVYASGGQISWHNDPSTYIISDLASVLNQWVQIAFTWNGSTGVITTYKNGIQVAQKTGIFGTVNNDTSYQAMKIGARGTNDQFLNGLIDEVRVYNRVLSTEEIRYHYNQGAPVGYWNFDDGSGTLAKDSSGNNNDGTIIGATWASGKYGSALSFDGNDYVDLPSIAAVDNVSLISSYTFSGWIKTNSSGVEGVFIRNGTTGAGNSVPISVRLFSNGRARFDIFDGSNNPFIDSTVVINDNNWHFVAAVRNSSSDKLELYIDGSFDASTTDTTTANMTTAIPADVGRNPSGNMYFTGLIDDARIYNYARTAEQIRTDYQAGMATYFGPSGKACSEDPASCMDKGLVGYWDMEEGGGSLLKDKSGNGNNGTLTNGPKWATGKNGGALQFDGKNDYVNVGDTDSLDLTQEITVEAWVKIPSNPKYAPIIIKGGGNPKGDNYLLLVDNSSQRVSFYVGKEDGTGSKSASQSYTTDVWQHWVGVFTNENIRLYRNSVSTTPTATGNNAYTNTGAVKIGANWGTSYYNGLIDDVRIYNRALSAEEVRYHYNQGAPVAQWDMDEGTGVVVNDSSGNHNRGTISGATWVAGKYGSALSFDGVNDYVDSGNGSSLNIVNEITIEAWVKMGVLPTDWGNNKIFYKAIYPNQGFWLDITPSAYQPRFWCSGGSQTYVIGGTTMSTGRWYHMAGTLSRSDGNLRVYLDGELDGAPVAGALQNANVNLIIGSWGSSYFNGSIDDIQIYNYARTAEQIRMDYQQGLAVHIK